MHMNIGALTQAQVAATDAQLASLWGRIGAQNNIVAQARESGFDRSLIESLTSRGNRLMAQIETLSIQVDGLSSAQYDEWRQRMQAFGTEVDLYESDVQAQLGTGGVSRNWKIAGSTAGALTIAAVIGGLVWYYGMRRA